MPSCPQTVPGRAAELEAAAAAEWARARDRASAPARAAVLVAEFSTLAAVFPLHGFSISLSRNSLRKLARPNTRVSARSALSLERMDVQATSGCSAAWEWDSTKRRSKPSRIGNLSPR